MGANFKTEQSQRRLLTAVIAAHPELKLNFKAIAKHFGPEDWGECGIEHFFRPLKKDAVVVRGMVERGEEAKKFYEKNNAGKSTSSASTPLATPKSNRKRAAPSAPSTGKPTASKKARGTTGKAVQPHVIDLDADEDDNELPAIETPTRDNRFAFTTNYEKQFFGSDAQVPALDLTQVETPNEDEEFKPVTPSDAVAYSFSHASQLPSGAGAGGYNSFATGHNPFAGSLEDSKIWRTDDFDDEV